MLTQAGVPVVAVENERATVEALREQGRVAVFGDAGEAGTLVQAHVAHAAVLVIPGCEGAVWRPLLEKARSLNPDLRIVALAESAEEVAWLSESGVDALVEPSQALAIAMQQAVLLNRDAFFQRHHRPERK